MRRIERLIDQSRKSTGSTEYTDTTGIQDEEFIQAANDAQERIKSLILQAHAEAFETTEEEDIVNGQKTYSLPSNTYLQIRVMKVELSESGLEDDYSMLVQRRDFDRRGSEIVLKFKPSTGKLRFTIQKTFPRIEKRRGKVSAVTLDSATSTITSLTLDPSVSLDSEEIVDEGYITIVDKDGVVKMKNIPVSAVNTTSGEVTLDGSFTYESGETIAVGNWVTIGKNSSTHCQLPDELERYLIAFMNWRILKRDSSNDSVEENAELKEMEDEIIGAFSEPDMALDHIPISNTEWLVQDEG